VPFLKIHEVVFFSLSSRRQLSFRGGRQNREDEKLLITQEDFLHGNTCASSDYYCHRRYLHRNPFTVTLNDVLNFVTDMDNRMTTELNPWYHMNVRYIDIHPDSKSDTSGPLGVGGDLSQVLLVVFLKCDAKTRPGASSIRLRSIRVNI
jgi:hypothetical protein